MLRSGKHVLVAAITFKIRERFSLSGAFSQFIVFHRDLQIIVFCFFILDFYIESKLLWNTGCKSKSVAHAIF